MFRGCKDTRALDAKLHVRERLQARHWQSCPSEAASRGLGARPCTNVAGEVPCRVVTQVAMVPCGLVSRAAMPVNRADA